MRNLVTPKVNIENIFMRNIIEDYLITLINERDYILFIHILKITLNENFYALLSKNLRLSFISIISLINLNIKWETFLSPNIGN